MLRKEFETWPIDPLSNIILSTVSMYVTNLGYMKDRPPYFMKLSDSGIKELNKMLVELDTATIISETDNQDLPNLINLKVK